MIIFNLFDFETSFSAEKTKHPSTLDKVLEWPGNVLFFLIMAPLAMIGYISHKIVKYAVAGFLVGWITSRDLER